MNHTSEFDPRDYHWTPEPEAALFVRTNVEQACSQSEWLDGFQRRLLKSTGTRLIDWLDHMVVAESSRLEQLGFAADEHQVFANPSGIFPKIVVDPDLEANACRLGVKVERIEDFLECHRVDIANYHLHGKDSQHVQMADIELNDGSSGFCIVERHGSQRMTPGDHDAVPDAARHVPEVLESFRTRSRDYDAPDAVFEQATQRFQAAETVLGKSLACDLFFQVEREYWQSKNHAGQVQFERQQSLGMGWANHDHHTYRCSRAQFRSIIACLELMGFACRERFYAGKDAGWGAQVLEHADCGIVIFADVDLSADEVVGDFPHKGLPEQETLGTVGLWCELHGDSFTSAGMHHLECQFDFAAARDQLAECGIDTMAPFTDFPYLKQAFTQGETWKVPKDRVHKLVARGALSDEDAERMIQQGVIGSHLEILERNDGFKGFNQTGVSQIIRATNPSLVGR